QRTAEEKKHLDRMARIERIIELTREPAHAELAPRATSLKDKELRRHERVLARLDGKPEGGKAKGKSKGKRKGKGRRRK
ncbi:MAG: hypothetical protein AAF658_19650, partial [Myxococcota bacterium]